MQKATSNQKKYRLNLKPNKMMTNIHHEHSKEQFMVIDTLYYITTESIEI